jgi:uncharacterized membrane protein YbhN (UPF0104 family)
LAPLVSRVGDVDWRAALEQVRPGALALLVVWNGLVALAFPLRWAIALRLLGQRAPFLALFRYRFAAFAVSYLTPGAQFGGEPLQVAALASRHRIPHSEALASVALDKLFDLLANFTFLALGLAVILQQGLLPHLSPGWASVWVGALLSGPLLYLGGLVAGRRPVSGLLCFVASRLPEKWCAWLYTVEEAEERLGCLLKLEPGAAVWLGLPGVMMIALSLSEYWLAAYALGVRLTAVQTVVALTAARLAFLTPLPAGVGALEAGQMLAMQALGFSPATGIAMSACIRIRDAALAGTGIVWGVTYPPQREVTDG